MKLRLIPSLLILTIACSKADKVRDFGQAPAPAPLPQTSPATNPAVDPVEAPETVEIKTAPVEVSGPVVVKIPQTRVEHLAVMPAAEVEKESAFPLFLDGQVIELLEVIKQKISNNVKVDEIAPLLKIALVSIKSLGTPNQMPVIESIVAYDDSLKKIADQILATPKTKSVSGSLSSIIKTTLDTRAYQGSSTDYPKSFELPAIAWRGQVYNTIQGTMLLDEKYVPGTRIGAKDDENETYAFMLPTIKVLKLGKNVESIFSVESNIKSPKKPLFGTFEPTIATFDIVGEAILPVCSNFSACSPIVALRLKNLSREQGSSFVVKVNDVKVEGKQVIYINRGLKEARVSILFRGKRAAEAEKISFDHFAISAYMTQDQTSALGEWSENFSAAFQQALIENNTASLVSAYAQELKDLSKKAPLSDEVIAVMANFIKGQTAPVKAYKEVLHSLLPQLSEVVIAFNNYAKAKEMFAALDPRIIEASGLSIDDLEIAESKWYLKESFCLKFYKAMHITQGNLRQEIQALEFQLH